MARHTIVDGYNVIRRHPTLAQMERQNMALARDALVSRLNNDPSLRRDAITVVFDGAKGGLAREHASQKGKVRVVYSRLGESADDVIKRLVEESTGEVRVISNDRELRDHASARGGTAVSIAPRPPARRTTDDDEEDYRRPGKKGPARRPKKADRRPPPHWSP